MKKLFFFAFVALCALMLSAKKIYLDTGGSSKWNQADATFFIHAWGGGSQDVQMSLVSGDIYSADIDDAQTSLLFVRMGSGATAIDWNKLWNKTADQTLTDGKDLFTITEWNYSTQISKGTWSAYSGNSGGDEGGQGSGEETGDWLLQGNFKASDWSGPTKLEAKDDGAENTLYATLTLEPGKEYEFKVQHGNDWLGNGGTMTQAFCTNWTMSAGDGSNCRIATTIKGDYEFAFNTSTGSLSVVYPYNPKQAKLYKTAVPEKNPDVMLQAFYWAHEGNTPTPYTEYGDVTWGKLAEEAEDLATYFDLVWLAPSQETADFTGYLPMNYSKQGCYEDMLGHHGHSPWGTETDLHRLISRLHQGGAKVVADIVLNHTSAGHVDEYDGDDKNWCCWTVNDFGRYGSFQPDWTWLTAEDEMFADDYMQGRIDRHVTGDCGNHNTAELTPDDKTVSYYSGTYNWDYQEYNSIYSRDLAHGKREVREMSRAYLTWMRDSIGYDGFRFDFMKGIAGSRLFDYNRASAPYFCVAEVFDGNIDKQLGFLKDANYETYVFDFPGKFHYYNDAIRTYNLKTLASDRYSLIHRAPKNTVTFIDNHDSFREGSNLYGTPNVMDDRQARMALAFLLSMPGVPCVVYPYWNNHKEECMAFIMARKAAGVHSESEIVKEWAGNGGEGSNYYTAMIKGTRGYLFLKLGYDCVPTDAPMEPSPDGQAWKCAWANRAHAGVWYTGEEVIPNGLGSCSESQGDSRAKKFLKNGELYIQDESRHIYDVTGRRFE